MKLFTKSLDKQKMFVELLKITPESRTFQNIIYEPHVWGGKGSFSVAFLKFSYK
jgi:hypothetical protein